MQIIRNFLRLVYRASKGLVHYPFDSTRVLNPNERSFVDQNTTFWKHIFGQRSNEYSGHIFIDLPGNPYLLHYIASIATIAGESRELKPLAVILPPMDSAQKEILNSYPEMDFVNIGRIRYALYIVLSLLLAKRACSRLSSPEDVLLFRVDGIEFGDLIYDSILSNGYATLSAVDKRVFRGLMRFFFNRFIVKHTLKRYKIKRAFVTHTIGNNAIFVRYFLQRGIQVVHCRCVSMTNIYKYSDLKEIRHSTFRPEPRYVDYMLRSQSNRIVALAEEYLNRRFNQGVNELDPALAFNPGNRTYRSREEFAKQYGLDTKRKNVFVMLHAFNDWPHTLGIDSILYRDYYEWFINTLRIARSVNAVNWIFKEHPSAAFYTTRDLDLNALFSAIDEENITFLSRDADFNAQSLRYLANSVVTCVGTAGLEYSSLGIPCVLGGKSPYSGFGFTIEPQTRTEYEQQLRQIDRLEPLGDHQVQRAKVIMYFQLCMGLNAPLFLTPVYDDYKKIRYLKGDEFWRDAARLIKELDIEVAKREIEKLKTFINNDSFIQYIDFDLYSFMRGAIHESNE